MYVEKRATSCQVGPAVQLNTDWANTCQPSPDRYIQKIYKYIQTYLPASHAWTNIYKYTCQQAKPGQIYSENLHSLFLNCMVRKSCSALIDKSINWFENKTKLLVKNTKSTYSVFHFFLTFYWSFKVFLRGDQRIFGNWENCKMH